MGDKITNKYLVAIAGPTAVGKTALAIDIARHFDTEILSADSRQMYRRLDIGTAKPTPEQRAGVPHHFIDTLDPGQPYDAGTFEREALQLLDEIFLSKDIALLVGGSGLYQRAVLDGFDEFPETSHEIRNKWEARIQAHGIEHLQDELNKRDPEYAEIVDLQNPRRLIRALSVIEQTGEKFSALRQRKPAHRSFQPIRIFCNLPREELYGRIDQRVDEMLVKGLVEETRALLPYRNTQALQTVGYRELFDYFDEKVTLEEAIDKIKRHSRNYAKRQVTWFRNQGDWWECNPPDIDQIISHIISARKPNKQIHK